MEFKNVIANRNSCKKYDSTKALEKDKLVNILNASRLAPTAKNNQPQHIYVLQDKKHLDIIDSVTPCRYGAPVVLVVAYDTNNVFTYPGGKRNSGIEDATIVATHLILAAQNEGVDSCWVNFFDPDKLKNLLGLPQNEEILMIMDLGYKAADSTANPNHDIRKDLSQTVTYM